MGGAPARGRAVNMLATPTKVTVALAHLHAGKQWHATPFPSKKASTEFIHGEPYRLPSEKEKKKKPVPEKMGLLENSSEPLNSSPWAKHLLIFKIYTKFELKHQKDLWQMKTRTEWSGFWP